MQSGFSYRKKIDWQLATEQEQREFFKCMPKELIDVLTEFKEMFDSQVLTIEIIISIDETL